MTFRPPWSTWTSGVRYLDRAVAGAVSALVGASLLQWVLLVLQDLVPFALIVVAPFALVLGPLRLGLSSIAHLATTRWPGQDSDDEERAASRAVWVDFSFALTVGVASEPAWSGHPLGVGAGIIALATLLLSVAPRGRTLWSTAGTALLAVGCLSRANELGSEQPTILHEQLWLIIGAAGLVIHLAASAVQRGPAIASDTPVARGSRQVTLGWLVLLGLVAFSAWRAQFSIPSVMYVAIVWLVVRPGAEIFCALPRRIESVLRRESRLAALGRLPTERTALALIVGIAWLQGEAAGSWTQLIALSAVLWCVRSGVSRLEERYPLQVLGFLLSLLATSVAAAVEALASQWVVHVGAAALCALWLARLAPRRREASNL